MTDNIVVLRLPQGQTRQREEEEERRRKKQKFTEQPEAERFVRWKVSKDGGKMETYRKP